MTMFTRAELASLRSSLSDDPSLFGRDPALAERLVGQAEYALDCAALLDEAIHHPAEPYSDCEALVARITDGVNAIWNRFHN